MLITSSMLPYFKDRIINQAEELCSEMEMLYSQTQRVDVQAEEDITLELVMKKSKSAVEQIEEASQEIEFFPVAEDTATKEEKMQIHNSKGALNYLKKFFGELSVDFQASSRVEIERTFKKGRDYRIGSDLFNKYMDSQYAKNYQHFANIVKLAEEEERLNPKHVDDMVIIDGA